MKFKDLKPGDFFQGGGDVADVNPMVLLQKISNTQYLTVRFPFGNTEGTIRDSDEASLQDWEVIRIDPHGNNI